MKVNIKKGEVSRFILEKLSETNGLVLDALFPRNTIGGKMWRGVLGLSSGRSISKEDFSARLSRLRRQGLVKREGSKRFASWVLTKDGKDKLKSYKYDISPTKPDGIP
ncbi:MAG: hypothetical protein AAB861_03120, partial [Patescibacteria group bacterium]